MDWQSTVAAISTPHGKGGIAVIRISGGDAVAVASAMFRPACGKPLSALPANRAVYGEILSAGKTVDTGIAVLYRAPKSFTGEDTCEISCHGGILLQQTVLEAAYLCGAVPAGAGEFTKRAFLNGKLSLTQAEAVMELIEAESREKLRLTSAQARGVLKTELDGIYADLKLLIASTYAYIDYPDEDLTDVSVPEMQTRLDALEKRLSSLLASYRCGKAICEGVRTVICGKPNTGKSSLLNMLLHEERAIVTEVAGTTRDTIEETATVGKVLVRLCDTAGIHETVDSVEQLGVQRASDKLSEAELILAVFDASREADADDRGVLARIHAEKERGAAVIVLLNKTDLMPKMDVSLFAGFDAVLSVSAKSGDDGGLTQTVERLFAVGDVTYDNTAILTNARQAASVSQALASVRTAAEALHNGLTQDIAALDLEHALSCIAQTDGRETASDVTDEIFSHFCVGK